MQVKNTEVRLQLLNPAVQEYLESNSCSSAECTVASRECSRCRLHQLESHAAVSQAAGESPAACTVESIS